MTWKYNPHNLDPSEFDYNADDFPMDENFHAADRFQEQLDALCYEWEHPEPVIDEWPSDWEDWVTEPSDEELEQMNLMAKELLRDVWF